VKENIINFKKLSSEKNIIYKLRNKKNTVIKKQFVVKLKYLFGIELNEFNN